MGIQGDPPIPWFGGDPAGTLWEALNVTNTIPGVFIVAPDGDVTALDFYEEDWYSYAKLEEELLNRGIMKGDVAIKMEQELKPFSFSITSDHINFPSMVNEGIMNIMDIKGRVISQYSLSNKQIINLPSLPAGIFFAQGTADNNTFNIKFLVKN